MNLTVFAVVYFVAVIILAHLFAPPQYHWVRNTISDLAAQGLQYQWIMQLGLIGFGLLLGIGLVGKFVTARAIFVSDILIMVYGLAVLLSGIYSTKPFIEGVSYSVREDTLHSLFAQVAGVFFTIAIFWSLFAASDPKDKLFHTLFFILVMGTIVFFGLEESGRIHIGRGLIQRVLYLVSFTWLLVSQYWGIVNL